MSFGFVVAPIQLDTRPLVSIPDPRPAAASLVGGKASSLQQISRCGLRVPAAVVLTTRFFAPWYAIVTASASWQALLQAPHEERPDKCQAVKASALDLPLTDEQQATLLQLRRGRPAGDGASLYAVRSSAIDEDLAGASFAGIYETALGVVIDALAAALRRCSGQP